MNIIKNYLIGFLGVLLLSSCGFYLRQDALTLPQPYKKVYLETPYPYSQFSLTAKDTLAEQQRLADNPSQAVKVVVTKENFTTQEDTLAASQQTRHYSVFYTVNYKVYFPHQPKPKLVSSLQTQSSTVTFPNEELSGSGKINIAKKEMANDLVNQLFYQLSSLANKS